MAETNGNREHWGSNLGFILAAAGSAIGLGNIWKFPYITGQHGGGAFVLVYLLCIAVIGLPVMLCEITLGRHTERNPVGAFKQLSPSSSTVAHLIGVGIVLTGVFLLCFGQWGWGLVALALGALVFRFGWVLVGGMGVLAGFLILSFYSVVAGWTIGYTLNSVTGKLQTDPAAQPPEVLARVLLPAAKTAPEAELAAIQENDDLSVLGKELATERLQRVYAGRYLEENFGVVLPVEDDMDRYEYAEIFDATLAKEVPRDKLLAHLTERYGGATEETGANGETVTVYPRKFHTAVAGGQFDAFMRNGVYAIGFHLLFMMLCVAIVCLGVQGGIEKASKILMPTLFVLIIALIVRGITLDGAVAGVRFYLSPDFSKLDPKSVLMALGHAFFSLSLGMGAMITYGSYVDKKQNTFLSTLAIVGLDTLIALMAGLAIFPAVFAEGFDPGAGPGLVFITLPAVFNRMPGGLFWASLFFLLLLVAALTSGVSLLEVVTAYFVDEWKCCRKKVTVLAGVVIFLIGSLAALSIADWDRIRWLQIALLKLFGSAKGSFFDVLDGLSSNWLLPLGGLFISVFVGWIWGTKKATDEIRKGSHNFADIHLFSLMAGLKDDESHNSEVHVLTLASVWGVFIRFISPVAVLIAFLNSIGWLDLTKKITEPDPEPPATEEAASVAPDENA